MIADCMHMHMQDRDDADCTFISEVFAGCVRYQPLIKVGNRLLSGGIPAAQVMSHAAGQLHHYHHFLC